MAKMTCNYKYMQEFRQNSRGKNIILHFEKVPIIRIQEVSVNRKPTLTSSSPYCQQDGCRCKYGVMDIRNVKFPTSFQILS